VPVIRTFLTSDVIIVTLVKPVECSFAFITVVMLFRSL